jgi:hypothetical protein
LRELAYESGFMRRASKKIDTLAFIELMCLESQKGSPSYNELASRFETTYKVFASKQAIWKRVNQSCVCFFQAILSLIIKSKLSKSEIEILKTNCKYKRIIVQDSTIIKLPLRLFKIFSGVSNAHCAVCNARIQGVYDLLSGNFISFSIDSYSKNDLSAAPELELLKGDLVLRDRGYYTNGEIKRHIDAGADYIYRHKFKNTFLDTITGEKINLLTLLKRKERLDMEVCLNDGYMTKVRIVAAPVSEEVANIRRMKAKKEMKGRSPMVELLNLMAWTIFITNIPKKQSDFKNILVIYSLRWRIEIIFKTWKSHMQFDKVHNVSENQLRTILTARLIMIVICTNNIYNPCYKRIYKGYNKVLSMMKFINYLMKNPEKIIVLLSINKTNVFNPNKIDDALIRYCAYDKRKRLNFNQIKEISFA